MHDNDCAVCTPALFSRANNHSGSELRKKLGTDRSKTAMGWIDSSTEERHFSSERKIFFSQSKGIFRKTNGAFVPKLNPGKQFKSVASAIAEYSDILKSNQLLNLAARSNDSKLESAHFEY